jgi:aminoglycoside phosphotransferase (APT) family kinase protein
VGEGRDAERVRALLRLQHPDLAGLPVRELVSAGGNRLWRLGDVLAVRLPRSPSAAQRLCRQHRWLPSLASALPLPVPVPLRIGAPSALFPLHWTVARWLPGEPATTLPHDNRSIDLLAGFLRALHVEAHPEAPAFRLASALPMAPRWIHGDLRPGTVVLDGPAVAGVVGFGGLSAGDPAVDLASLGRWLPAGAFRRLLTAYGADRETASRIDGWAARLGEA